MKRFYVALIIIIFVVPAFAGEIEDLQAKRKNIDGQLQQLQGQANLIKSQVSAALESYGKVIGQAQLLIQKQKEIDANIKALSVPESE